MSGRVAIIASGVTSPLYSVLEFANRLRNDGQTVRIFAPKSSGSLIKAAGIEHAVIPKPVLSGFKRLLPYPGLARFKRNGRRDRLNQAVAALGVGELKRDLSAFSPDLIIVDCELHAHIILALSLGFPVVQSNNMFLSPPGLRAPPLHTRIVPGQGLWGSKPGVLLAWSAHMTSKIIRLTLRRWRDWGGDHPSALEALAHQHGVDIAKIRNLITWQIPWTYRIQTVLLLPEALDLPAAQDAGVEFLGPMIWRQRPEKPHDQAAIDRFRNITEDKKRIYAAFGTRITPGDAFVTRLWDVARAHPEWHMLCVVGSHWTTEPSRQPPDNVDIVSWAPQLEMLDLADLAILHGGTSGLVEAVEAGTPMLIYPHDLDQFGSAARAVFHGIGRMGDERDGRDRIENDIAALLSDQGIRSACQQMRVACRSERDASAAETYVRSAIRERTNPSEITGTSRPEQRK